MIPHLSSKIKHSKWAFFADKKRHFRGWKTMFSVQKGSVFPYPIDVSGCADSHIAFPACLARFSKILQSFLVVELRNPQSQNSTWRGWGVQDTPCGPWPPLFVFLPDHCWRSPLHLPLCEEHPLLISKLPNHLKGGKSEKLKIKHEHWTSWSLKLRGLATMSAQQYYSILVAAEYCVFCLFVSMLSLFHT